MAAVSPAMNNERTLHMTLYEHGDAKIWVEWDGGMRDMRVDVYAGGDTNLSCKIYKTILEHVTDNGSRIKQHIDDWTPP